MDRCGRFRGIAMCAWRAAIVGIAIVVAPVPVAQAGINLLAPGRTVDPSAPFRLTLIVTGEADERTYVLPETLRVTLTPELGATERIDMRREAPLDNQFGLRRDEFRRIDYVGEVPSNLRGRVRVDALDVDAPPMLVQLVQPPAAVAALPVPPAPLAPDAATFPVGQPAANVAPTVTLTVRPDNELDSASVGRLSFYDPMFFVAGPSAEANAQLQLSFKMRLYEPRQPSRRFLDNLYFGYTQTSFWDLTSDSKPFLDTSYRPAFFYFVPDIGWRPGGQVVGLAAGYEHESNGKDGDASRSIDSLFVKPIFTWGDPADFHWTFAPKLYLYLDKSENEDIQKYRGYGDFRFTYGSNSAWQLAASLRKGTDRDAYNIDAQWTYPINRVFDGLTGYFMVQLSNGWGETLLNYNVRESTTVRFGYAISR
jgi:outer membrane phospholipase A